MPTNFLEASGTNGFIASPFDLMTTELNSLASGAAATSSVGGSSGAFNQANTASGLFGSLYFTAGGSFTPIVGQFLAGWFLLSPDGGTTFESAVSTPSTTVAALSRSPDFIIPLDNAAYASGKIRWCQGRRIILPWESFKIILQNSGTTALPSSGNKISVGPIAVQY